jgi:hypothetical protein
VGGNDGSMLFWYAILVYEAEKDRKRVKFEKIHVALYKGVVRYKIKLVSSLWVVCRGWRGDGGKGAAENTEVVRLQWLLLRCYMIGGVKLVEDNLLGRRYDIKSMRFSVLPSVWAGAMRPSN